MDKRLKIRYGLIAGIITLGVGGYFAVDSMIQTNMRGIELDKDTINKNKKENADFNLEGVKPLSEQELLENSVKRTTGYGKDINYGSRGVIGGIYVPSVDIKLPISKGVGNNSLSRGVGTAFEDREMGKGNYVLLGHNSPNKHVLFSPLEDMAVGDKIYVTDATNMYEYETTEKKRIHQSQSEVMNNTEQDMITLITCFGGLNTTKRTVVTGKLKQKYPVSDAEKKIKTSLNIKE
ncbi:class A sortase [Bacillus cereus]|uniref:class A sortase n=1 Tax=Bacillus cereus TaxID=1396 RepID=UPI003D1743C4